MQVPAEASRAGGQSRPLVPEIGVVGLVPDRWGGPWTARHHILTRLADAFNVVWLDPAQEWRDHWFKSREYGPPFDSHMPDAPGFAIYSPGRWLPLVYRPQVVARLMESGRLRRAARLLRARGARIFVLYLWRPEFETALDSIAHDYSCYHIDDEYSFSPVDTPLSESEARLIRRVDQVIVHSPALLEKKGYVNPHTLLIPNGTDFQAFATPCPEPGDMASIPHPRIGYVGMIKEQLDLGLLAALARDHPAWSFVLVGPARVPENDAAVRALRASPNVFFPGGRPADALPAYMQHMDVCIMPYVMDGYTKYIYPMKLHEYLATGRPVVARPIRSLAAFDGVVRLVTDAAEWSEALQEALETKSRAPEQVARRQEVAREHDWGCLTLRVARSFCEAVLPAALPRLEAAAPKPGTEKATR